MKVARYLSLLVAAGSLAQGWADDTVVFRSGVSLIRVDAEVLDRDNRPIAGLGVDDFLLWEAGKQLKIQSVDAEKLPLDLLLLVDVSLSMRPHVQRISAASHQALRQLRPEDRLALMTFSRSSRVRMAFRNNSPEAQRQLEFLLDSENFQLGTDLTRAMQDAAGFMAREGRPDARRAIVILTDDQTSERGSKDVEGVSRALARADTILCALIAPDAVNNRGSGRGPFGGGGIGGRRRGGGFPGGVGRGGRLSESAGTREIAIRSGGDSMPVSQSSALEDTLTRIRQRYALFFSQPEGVQPGAERDIQVALADAVYRRNPGAQVHYRRSYYAPGGPAPVEITPPEVTSAAPAPVSSDDSDRPRIRRRPGVSQVPDGTRSGPVILDQDSGPPPAAPTPATAAPTPATAAPPPPQPAPPKPGWREARPDELPHQ